MQKNDKNAAGKEYHILLEFRVCPLKIFIYCLGITAAVNLLLNLPYLINKASDWLF